MSYNPTLPLELDQISPRQVVDKDFKTNGKVNRVAPEDTPVHNWYRFILSYPPHLVRRYFNQFELRNDQLVLDPFCGTGTTLVEAKKQSIRSIGIEAHPMVNFASNVKTDWDVDSNALIEHAEKTALVAKQRIKSEPLRTLNEEQTRLLLKNSISPLPLHKTLVLRDCIKEEDTGFQKYELLALAKATVFSISNLHFGPEVGVRGFKKDADVIYFWLSEMYKMAHDLKIFNGNTTQSYTKKGDARKLLNTLQPKSIDAVITSPPYPNEKDYTRTTRLESVLLGFLHNKEDLRALKQTLIRSNSRNVYVSDDDDAWIRGFPEILKIADDIEKRRLELGKTSGFEKTYGRVTKLYFGGMAKHFSELRTFLKPGAMLAYVVGDQASYLRVMIRTGQLLAHIAESLGYEIKAIDLFRTRLATATGEQLREEVVILSWPGK